MILPDVNLLIYAFRRDLPQHGICRAWLAAMVRGDARFGLAPMALSAVVRITTNPRAFRTPSAIEEAFGFCEDLLRQPHCQVVEPRRTALGHLQTPVHRNRHARIARHRCLVRSARDRVGLRVDNTRSRLCAVPRIEMASTGGLTEALTRAPTAAGKVYSSACTAAN
jgi:predicted nucleic acid-binding protein